MSEWKEGRPEKVDDYISDLNKLKDTIHQTISDLKAVSYTHLRAHET